MAKTMLAIFIRNAAVTHMSAVTARQSLAEPPLRGKLVQGFRATTAYAPGPPLAQTFGGAYACGLLLLTSHSLRPTRHGVSNAISNAYNNNKRMEVLPATDATLPPHIVQY